jgi:hypothetical protein
MDRTISSPETANVLGRLVDFLASIGSSEKYRARQPGAAGVVTGLELCDRTTDGVITCRWARGRTSPGRITELASDMKAIVQAPPTSMPKITVRWGEELRRSYSAQELAEKVELDSLRKARSVCVEASGAKGRAKVTFDMCEEPGLSCSITGGDDNTAQQLKDAVDRGKWNPMSGEKVIQFSMVLAYSVVALIGLLIASISLEGGSLVVVATLAISGAALLAAMGLSTLLKYLFPPVEIFATKQTTLMTVLKAVAPIAAPAVGVAAALARFAQ